MPPTDAATVPLQQLLAHDLRAATGRAGWRAMASAWVFDPGFATVARHRVAQALYRGRWQRLAKWLWRRNIRASACHLHLDCTIGPGLKLPHPTGVVIGEGVVIGPEVTLYQNTTIGRDRGDTAYPVLAQGVVVYANAVIVGRSSVGAGATVGAGAFVKGPVAAGSTVAGHPARAVAPRRPLPAAVKL